VGRLLFIVARGAPERYDFLRYAFAGDDDVQVIFDRRRQQRRRRDLGNPVERRRKDRRVQDVGADLARQGYAVVRWP
jgi:hypothetical protein